MPCPPAKRLALALTLSLSGTYGTALAQETVPCITAPRDVDDRLSEVAPAGDTPIDITSDTGSLGVNGDAVLTGNVVVRQGDREIRAENIQYNAEGTAIKVEGAIEYRDPLIIVRGNGGNYSQAVGADFRAAEFEIPARPARGTAGEMSLDTEGRVRLRDVMFTSCPRDDNGWRLQADEIELDTTTREGTGRGARVEFKGVPILYTPYISFPLGSQRKSGFLFPSAGYSTRSGFQASVPYYWNIAPQYDLTFEPTLYSRRGVDLAGEARYLSGRNETTLNANVLPADRIFDDDRSYVRLAHRTSLPAGWRLQIAAANVSDNQYFEDFGQGPEGTSVAFLERILAVSYRDANWRVLGEVQDFQTIESTIVREDEPYTSLPRLFARGDFALGERGLLRYGFDAETVNFDRNTGVTGWRFDAAPRVGLAWDGPGYFLRPGVAWRSTQYSLDDVAPGSDDSPSRSLPIVSLDAGLIFEGATGSRGQRRLTLEPRALYLYAPYRDQDALPLFDTALPDLNLVQLFRTNRFVGADRVGDANQLSVGVTSRVFDTRGGEQYLAATLGQTVYFETPRVRLPDEAPTSRNTSDLVAELELTAYKDWSAQFGVQWNPDESQRERMQARLQYRPAGDSVVNLSYRFQQERLEQVEGSAAWPVKDKWRVFARYIYSLEDNKSLDQFAGVEYISCCWRVRTAARRFVSSRTGESDKAIYLQLELGGLANVGTAAQAFLEGAIRGYSPPRTTP